MLQYFFVFILEESTKKCLKDAQFCKMAFKVTVYCIQYICKIKFGNDTSKMFLEPTYILPKA